MNPNCDGKLIRFQWRNENIQCEVFNSIRPLFLCVSAHGLVTSQRILSAMTNINGTRTHSRLEFIVFMAFGLCCEMFADEFFLVDFDFRN